MKALLLLSVGIFAASTSLAQDMQRMDSEQMQAMMAVAEEMNACMGELDSNELQALSRQAEKMQQEISALCDAGKRSEATSAAIKYGLEIVNNPTVKKARECTAKFQEKLPDMMKSMMPQTDWDKYGDTESSTQHLCDSM